MKKLSILLLGFLFVFQSCNDDDDSYDPSLCSIENLEQTPINNFQVVGSHNSYRKRTYGPLFYLFFLVTNIIPDDWIPDDVNPSIEWDYDHAPFRQQFNSYDIRSLEIDLYYDPEGGNFANRLGNALIGQPIQSGEPALNQPGMKVMHIPHLDYMTHYLTFVESLEAIEWWSNANPNHFPITVMLELKDLIDFNLPGFYTPFTENGKNKIAEEILSVFDTDQLITPEDLRTHGNLYESIQANGWPTLAESRGKVMFIVMKNDEISNTIFGSNDDISLNDNHIFKIIDNSIGDFSKIQEAVNDNLFVRTRADGGTREARTGNTEKRDMAFASGAQIISTDYYRPDFRHLYLPQEYTDYHVQWPNSFTARSNENFECFVN